LLRSQYGTDIGTRIKVTDAAKLQNEYAKLVEGLQEAEEEADEDQVMSNPVLPDDLLHEAIPGNIRKAEHFVAFLKRFVEYLKVSVSVQYRTSLNSL
jgi:DNA excision repair protein ERCC-2